MNENNEMKSSETCDDTESGIFDKPGLDLTNDYPTDRGHFTEFDTVKSDLKRSILLHGPCKPTYIDFPYSPDGKDCAYCEICWLFADRQNRNFKINWILGINDWHHIGEKIGTHEISQQHIQATEVRVRWLKNETIDKHMEDKIIKEASFWRSVLIRLVKIILFLTAGNTALRGNENKVLSILANEVIRSKYYSIIVDSTQDITKIDQLSVILRYVVLNYETKSLEVKESFFGFFEFDNHGSKDYENLIYDVLKKIQFRHPKLSRPGCPRWASLAFGDDTAKTIRLKVFKKVCPIRWEARHSSVSALKQRYIGVIKSLTYMCLSSNKVDEKHMVISIKKNIESFEFLLMLCLWERVLHPLHGISKLLQKQDIDLKKALDRLTDAYTCMQQLRNDYCSVVENANNLAIKWGIPTDDKVARQKKARLFFDEIDGDRRMNITQDNFKIKDQMKLLLKDHMTLYKCINQIIQALASFIIENDFATSYSDILGACIIYLTLPVTVATAERSFSKLKIIKNYLRNSIGQERLSYISVLNIEHRRTKEIDMDKILTNFSNMKASKMKFD
ncbi:uncharacterized protein LOC111031275 [Myzus persicae]|uniref:uncharacterized protein LOC111031275 n=1 Tax=Myzus persicae TaxID=13164 RepID=UPI000B934679|nr:uncharacterized protein LOC111031275 [Myzus persicae]